MNQRRQRLSVNQLLALFFAVLLLLPLPLRAAATLPTLQAQDLNEKTYTLPADLPGPNTLVLVAFKREQQAQVDTWIEALALKSPNTEYDWIELPVLEDYGTWFKWLVDNGMRRGIKGEFNREKVITVYTDKSAFRQATGIPHENTIQLLVVRPSGEVVDRIEGPYSPALLPRVTPYKRVTPGQ
ncbi:MAG TPA: hypothetical protein VFV39_09870 [Limnobacter sp.]|nr:hypothetical protein [Limnobacter sp.]